MLRQEIGDPARAFAWCERYLGRDLDEIASAPTAADIWPVVTFDDAAAGTVPAKVHDAVRRRGCVVIKGVFSGAQVRRWDDELASLDAAAADVDPTDVGEPYIRPVYW